MPYLWFESKEFEKLLSSIGNIGLERVKQSAVQRRFRIWREGDIMTTKVLTGHLYDLLAVESKPKKPQNWKVQCLNLRVTV